MIRKKTTVIAVIFLTIGAVVSVLEYKTGSLSDIYYLVSLELKERLDREPFDARKWKDPKLALGSNAVRRRMVDDLIRRYRLLGMTRKEVILLLGKPDGEGSTYLAYELGPERGRISIDYECLILKIGMSGRVTEVRFEVS